MLVGEDLAADFESSCDNLWKWSLSGWCFALLAYFCKERSFLHRSWVERIFWPIVYGWSALLWLYLPTRTGALGVYHLHNGKMTPTDVALVLIAALLGFAVHSHNRRQRMASRFSPSALQRVAQTLSLDRHVETIAARVATSRLESELGVATDRLDQRGLFDGLFHNLWETVSGQKLRRQDRILAALEDCWQAGPGDLLYIFNSGDIDLPQLFAASSEAPIMDFLLRVVAHMDVITKARIVDALHRQNEFVYNHHLQRVAATMILHTLGQELSLLKSLVDEMGGFYSLYRLIFHDFASDTSEKVLRHLEEEGLSLRQDVKARFGTPGVDALPRKILSDIDDTLFCSGGHFPAGVDRRFKKKQIYPGVLAFYRELDSQWVAIHDAEVESKVNNGGTNDSITMRLQILESQWTDVVLPPTETIAELKDRLIKLRQGWQNSHHNQLTPQESLTVSFASKKGRAMSNLAFLSARPHAYKDYMESRSYRFFWNLHTRGMLHCMPTLLTGQLGTSLRAALLGAVVNFWPHIVVLLVVMWVFAYKSHQHCALSTLLLGVFSAIAIAAWRWRKVVWAPVGLGKVVTFRQYQKLYSECSFVFVGDNGQGDLLCGEELVGRVPHEQHAEWQQQFGQQLLEQPHISGDAVEAIFIHTVLPQENQLTSFQDQFSVSERAAEWADRRIYFHHTYVGAAANAYRAGLISAEGLSRVGQAAIEDFVRMRIDQLSDDRRTWAERIRELNKDICQANALLPETRFIRTVPEWVGVSGSLSAIGFALDGSEKVEAISDNTPSPMYESQAFSFHTAPPRKM